MPDYTSQLERIAAALEAILILFLRTQPFNISEMQQLKNSIIEGKSALQALFDLDLRK